MPDMDSKKTIGFKIKANGKEEFFKFSIPPESMTIKQPQRVSRTKTFGGIVEEDYGLDNPIINISGTMAGKRQRQVLSTYGKVTDGYGEIMMLYDHFIKYKNFDKNKAAKVYFLDYSQDEVTDVWEVSFDDFTIERNAEKPYYYDYNIQLFCVMYRRNQNVANKDSAKISKITAAINKIREFKSKVAAVAQKIKSANAAINKLKSEIYEILTFADCFCDIVDAVLDVGRNGASILNTPIRGIQDLTDSYADLTAALIRENTDIALTAYENMLDVVQYPARTANKLVDSLLYAKKGFSNLASNAEELFVSLEKGENPLDEYNKLVQNWHELTCACSEACAFGKRVESRTSITVENTDGETYEINSLKETPVLPGESISDVAFRIYGDVNKAWLILAFNDLDDLQELKVGISLIIPSKDSATIEGNPVYDETFADNYGSDIASDFAIENNDFVLVRGRDNIMQAISLRMNTKKGCIKRNPDYGLPSLHNKTIGEIKNEIKDAVLADIRVSSVNDVSVQIDADLSNYSITTVLKDNVQTTIGGIIK